MVIKLIGCGALGVACVIMAISYRRFQWKKLDTVDGFIALIFYIKGQIDCYGMPLCDIMRSLPEDLDLPRDTRDFGQMLKGSKIYLEREAYRLLERFYSEFGSLYREEQIRRCDYYIEQLGEQRRLLFEDLPARTKIGGTICICSLIGLLIILW